jgi:hypothetical protein
VRDEGVRSASFDEGITQVVVDRLFRNPERPPDSNGGQLSRMDQAIHGHFRHAHERGDLRDREEPHFGQRFVAWPLNCTHDAPNFQHATGAGFPTGRRSRTCVTEGSDVGVSGEGLVHRGVEMHLRGASATDSATLRDDLGQPHPVVEG